MAKRKQAGRTGTHQGSRPAKKSSANAVLIGVAGVAIVSLLALGMFQVLDIGGGQEVAGSNLQIEAGNLQSVSVEDGSRLESVAAPVDRETQYLGPDTDPATLALAEVGEVGKPTLVWFHADW